MPMNGSSNTGPGAAAGRSGVGAGAGPAAMAGGVSRLPAIAWLSSTWLMGTLLAARFGPPAGVSLALGAAGLVTAHRWRGRRCLRPAAALLACLALGAARFTLALPDLGPGHVAALVDGPPVRLRGRIVAEPDRRDRRSDYRVALDAVWVGNGAGSGLPETAPRPDGQAARPRHASWRPIRGTVLVQLPSFPAYRYGETVQLEGRLERPPELDGFDYAAWLARKGIHAIARRPALIRLSSGGGNPLRRGLIALRERGRRALAQALPEPEAALATGILLGDARRIPAAVDEAFRLTNTSHVIAISGSNISLLVVLLMATLGRALGRRRALPAILIVLAGYSSLVGADAAVVRAAIMGSLMVLAGHLGRPGDAIAALMAAAWAMSLWNPHVAWDLGFQLSFAATAGLIAFSARFSQGLEGWLARRIDGQRASQLVQLVEEALLVTLAAQLTTWPIIAWQMGQVSVTGLAANFLILPAQPAVMGLGGLAMALGMLWAPAGRLVGLAAWLPLAWTIRVVEAFAGLPLASVALPLPGWAMLLYYLLLAAWLQPGLRSGLRRWVARRRGRPAAPAGSAATTIDVRARRVDLGADAPAEDGSASTPLDATALAPVATRSRARAIAPTQAGRRGHSPPPSWTRPVRATGTVLAWLARGWRPVLLLAGACGLAWMAAYARPDGLLHLYQLDVGQGDAILVVSPEGRRMLVDGGPSPSALLDALGRRLPPWDRRLDLVVLTHPDADHVGGLPALLERYAIGSILDPELPAESPDAGAWAQALAESDAGHLRASAGGRILLDATAGVSAELLWPPEPRFTGGDAAANNNSTVILLQHGRNRFLLTGDIEADAETALLASGVDLRADVLKVAHHGSGGSSTADFLAAVSPRLALIGVGADNRYGHPDPGALERLAPALVRRTDWQGSIEVLSDGRDLWLR